MVGTLLLRGMLVGFLAGLICFAFLRIAGEPAVDRAIAFEAQMDEAKEQAEASAPIVHGMPSMKEDHEPELVSRPVQAGIGLFTGVAVYSTAFGGLFALAFAAVYGRMSPSGPRSTSALLATAGFLAIYLVPSLKYPANPPSVGDAETIGLRTALYFSMIAISLAAMISSGVLRKRLLVLYDPWNASFIAASIYLIIVVGAGLLLPSINEVPEHFPAAVLWQFRLASISGQAIMWAATGLVFGALTERAALAELRLHPKKAAFPRLMKPE
jgi:predicted cobalt transporter CbtA